jgi:hypothetical protein
VLFRRAELAAERARQIVYNNIRDINMKIAYMPILSYSGRIARYNRTVLGQYGPAVNEAQAANFIGE